MNVKLKLHNLNELRLVDGLFKDVLKFSIDKIDYLEYYNALQVLKKFADTIFKKTIAPGKINFTLEINQFNSFVKILNLHKIPETNENIFISIFANEIIKQGRQQLQYIEHHHHILKREIL